MKKRITIIASILLMSLLIISSPVIAMQNDEYEVTKIQSNIINDINKSLGDKSQQSIDEQIYYVEKKEVIVDLRDNLNVIKKSLSEPITIYEEIITKTYELEEPFNDSLSSNYEERIVNTSRTYNGVTTTVTSTIGYYIMEDVIVDGTPTDAFRLVSSNISFYASGYAHVSKIEANHHQEGPNLNNHYVTVFNGNLYESDRTNKAFSIYDSNGLAAWSRPNSNYTALSKPGYSTGFVGSFYTIYFTWDLGGGGNYGYDTLERTNGFGNLPS